jgi:hypothetical protein
MQYQLKYFIYFHFLVIILFNNSFSQIKNDFIISETGTMPVIIVDSTNDLHITWTYGSGVFYLYTDSMGIPLISPVRFKGSEGCYSSRLAVQGDQRIVVWREYTPSPIPESYASICGNLFSVFVDTLSNIEFVDDEEVISPDVCWLSDSLLIVVWSEWGYGVYGRLYSVQSGFIGDELVLSDFDHIIDYRQTRVLKIPDQDKFLVIWIDDHPGEPLIYGRQFDLTGVPLDSSFLISDTTQSTDFWLFDVDISNEGDFVIVTGDGDEYVRWRWYNKECVPYGGFRNITTAQDSVYGYASVAVAINTDGKGVVVWEEEDNGQSRINGQRFDSNRNLYGSKFNATKQRLPAYQFWPEVDILNDRIYTVWHEGGIWASIIDYYDPPANIEKINPKLPASYFTLTNYPNPFNSSTRIKFTLPGPASTKIEIFNSLGQKVSTLQDEYLLAGHHEIEFEAQNLSSGIYFCRIQAGELKDVIKMILIK